MDSSGIGEKSDDIESRLKSDWWRNIFDATYLITDADAVEDDAITSQEVDALLKATNLSSRNRVLDLCCGQGRHCIELYKRGYEHIVGVDASAYLIEVARRRAENAHLMWFKVQEASAITPEDLGKFDLVTLLGNSFGYSSTEDDSIILNRVREVLRPKGRIYLDLADGGWLRKNFSQASWEWVENDMIVCRERKLSGDRLISREIVIKTREGVVADRTYAEHLYTQEQIIELLNRVGFTDATVVDMPVNGGMDPGMMGHRFTVVATKTAKVTVLLGDPRLPDAVKPTGGFDQADLETVSRMKEALATLHGYRFKYQDEHDPKMFLRSGEDCDVILNLCDEGYRNDPRSEAVVPAMLDALGVTYTGAGPGCLNLCYDKSLIRGIAEREGIAVPTEGHVRPGQSTPKWQGGWPAIVKPNFGDSSVGIDATSVVYSQEALEAAVDARREHGDVLIQEFLTGTEYSVGLIGNGADITVLPVLEVDYSGLGTEHPRLLGYESKWLADSPWWKDIKYKRADNTPKVLEMIQGSKRLFQILGCRDYARFDWRCGSGVDGWPHLLEVNPNPGWCWDGKMALMAAMDNISYADLLRLVIDAALRGRPQVA